MSRTIRRAARVAAGLLILPLFPAAADVFTVTRTDDPPADACMPTDCSLREAVQAANTRVGPDVVSVPAGAYELQLAGMNEDGAFTGDIDILDDVDVVGAGSASTTIDARALDRVFDTARATRVAVRGIAVVSTLMGQGGGGVRSGVFGAGATAATSLVLADFSVDRLGVQPQASIEANGMLDAEQIVLTDGPFEFRTFQFTGSTLRLRNALLTNNSDAMAVTLDAGGIARLSDITLTGSSTTNFCSGLSMTGAGTLVLERATFGNSFAFGFGIVCIMGTTTATVRDSTFSNNGQVALYVGTFGSPGTATAHVVNSTFHGDNPIGVIEVASGGVVTLRHVTVHGASGGSAIRVATGGTLNLVNSVIEGNCEGAGSFSRSGNTTESPGNTCHLAPPEDRVGVSTAQLNLGALGNNGGPTATRLPLAGSVVIDDVLEGASSCPATDQREYIRVAPCDAGAVEAGAIDDVLFRDGYEY